MPNAMPGDMGGNGTGVPLGQKKKPQPSKPHPKPANPPAHAGGGGGTVQQIIDFFRGKGLNDAAIAGILGNWQVESGFSTTSYNSGEGAHGLANWEGSRWPALESFAASRGTSPYDLETQLEFTWHELNTGYTGVLAQLRSATSASAAATVWNLQYEGSADRSGTREANASQYFSSGFKGVANTAVNSSGGGGRTGSTQGMTAAALASASGLAAGLLNSVPELRQLMQSAQASGEDVSQFLTDVENSQWWKTHSASARAFLTQQFTDPASLHESISQAELTIQSLDNQNGWSLKPDQIANIAKTALLTGNASNTQWLTQQVGRRQDYSNLQNVDELQGGMAATASQLQQIAADYGYKYHDQDTIAQQAKQILMGNTTIDTYTQNMKEFAKSAFPGLSAQIDAGQTVAQIAQPYMASMSNLLELDPSQVTLQTPKIRRALQGTQGVSDQKNSVPTVQPLWQFENEVRKDPRWAYTDNAHQDVSTMLLNLGQEWGFA